MSTAAETIQVEMQHQMTAILAAQVLATIEECRQKEDPHDEFLGELESTLH